jgi:hypothetical protein
MTQDDDGDKKQKQSPLPRFLHVCISGVLGFPQDEHKRNDTQPVDKSGPQTKSDLSRTGETGCASVGLRYPSQ